MGIVTSGLQLSLNAKTGYSGSGATWSDQSGNGYNFTLQNAPTWDSRGWFTFNGTNQYARLDSPATSLINWATTDYTAAFWVNNTAFTSSQNGYFVGFGNSETNNVQYWTIGTSSTGLVGLYMYNGGIDAYWGSTYASLNTWNYIVMTQASGTITMYMNGSVVFTSTVAGTPQYSSSYPMNLGGTSNFINGKVYAAQVYTAALSSADIAQNYAFGLSELADTIPAYYYSI